MTIPDRVEDPTTAHDDEAEILFCTVHPTVETSLRCNRCGRPMCAKCAVRTPVGYRCKECVREQQDKFFDAQMLDYFLAGGISLALSFFAALLIARFSFFFILAFFLSPAAGGAIGSVIWQMTKKRRGRYTAYVVGLGVVVGALPVLPANPLVVGIYLFMATGAAVARFRLNL
jgi:Fe2+ transport system protein B